MTGMLRHPTNMAKIIFVIMATVICIKMVRGTFFQLEAIASHFLHIISNLETLIKSISPGGAGGPNLPTRLVAYPSFSCDLLFHDTILSRGIATSHMS